MIQHRLTGGLLAEAHLSCLPGHAQKGQPRLQDSPSAVTGGATHHLALQRLPTSSGMGAPKGGSSALERRAFQAVCAGTHISAPARLAALKIQRDLALRGSGTARISSLGLHLPAAKALAQGVFSWAWSSSPFVYKADMVCPFRTFLRGGFSARLFLDSALLVVGDQRVVILLDQQIVLALALPPARRR